MHELRAQCHGPRDGRRYAHTRRYRPGFSARISHVDIAVDWILRIGLSSAGAVHPGDPGGCRLPRPCAQDASPGLQVSIAVVSLPQALISILLAFELFAGWTAYWVNLGIAGYEPTGSDPVTLWAVERSYLWNALDMVPLLDINHVLRFAEPPGPADWKAGFVLVLFRAIVLVPIAGIFLIAARAAIDGISKRSFAEDTPSKREVVRIVDDIAAGRIDIGTAVNNRGAADDAVPRPRRQGHSMEDTAG